MARRGPRLHGRSRPPRSAMESWTARTVPREHPAVTWLLGFRRGSSTGGGDGPRSGSCWTERSRGLGATDVHQVPTFPLTRSQRTIRWCCIRPGRVRSRHPGRRGPRSLWNPGPQARKNGAGSGGRRRKLREGVRPCGRRHPSFLSLRPRIRGDGARCQPRRVRSRRRRTAPCRGGLGAHDPGRRS